MYLMRPETLYRDELRSEITAINREFLTLLRHPALDSSTGALGMPAPQLAVLRGLAAHQIRALAKTPLLLVDTRLVPEMNAAEESSVYELPAATASSEWYSLARAFTDHLLACLWQFARQDPDFVALALGVDRLTSCRIAELGFEGLRRCAIEAHRGLNVRFADHPTCWTDLLRAARSEDPVQIDSARLWLIPLTLRRSRQYA